MMYDDDDVKNVALCAWKEARGEGRIACQAVMFIIKNRVGYPGFPSTVHDVIYQKNAFTSMSVSSDPEYNLDPNGHPDYGIYVQCLTDAPDVLSGKIEDVTCGSHYYANLRNVSSGWFERVISGPFGTGTKDHPMRKDIGKQRFFL